jgi:hypothetical protein
MSRRGDEAAKRIKALAAEIEKKKATASPDSIAIFNGILDVLYDMNLRVHALEVQDGPSDAFVGMDGPHKLG